MKRLVLALGAGAVISLVTVGLALGKGHDTYKIGASLNPGAEALAPKGAAKAYGTFTGKYVENKTGAAVFTGKLTFSGLTGAATAAHFHLGRPGVSGPVLAPLCGPCKSGQAVTAKLTKAAVAAIEAGKVYVNVHTKRNAGGEIRGQVIAIG
jgi:hypothetical protein